jgi:hypothetical protein
LPTENITIEQNVAKHIDITQLLYDAKLTARLCNCEAGMLVSSGPIQVCSSCLHTACIQCAGNPRHAYESEIGLAERRFEPEESMKRWKGQLPTRLAFTNFPDISQLVSNDRNGGEILRVYADHLAEACIESQYFHIGPMLRQEGGWTVTYNSSHASLKLRIGPAIEWALFLKCPQDMAGNHPLRHLLEQPIARAASNSTSNLLEVSEWQVFVPRAKSIKLRFNSSSLRTKSWRNRLGLTGYTTEMIPTEIDIVCADDSGKVLAGRYDLLQHCGGASGCFYKRSSDALYMFLDPDPVGPASQDGVSFSYDHHRKHYGESRISLAQLDPIWRPWHMDAGSQHNVNAVVSGF